MTDTSAELTALLRGGPRVELIGKFPRNRYAVSLWEETPNGTLSIDVEFTRTRCRARRIQRLMLLNSVHRNL